MDMQNYLKDTQGDYMKKILMIEWKHKKIEDTCDMIQHEGKMCYHFFFNKKLLPGCSGGI